MGCGVDAGEKRRMPGGGLGLPSTPRQASAAPTLPPRGRRALSPVVKCESSVERRARGLIPGSLLPIPTPSTNRKRSPANPRAPGRQALRILSSYHDRSAGRVRGDGRSPGDIETPAKGGDPAPSSAKRSCSGRSPSAASSPRARSVSWLPWIGTQVKAVAAGLFLYLPGRRDPEAGRAPRRLCGPRLALDLGSCCGRFRRDLSRGGGVSLLLFPPFILAFFGFLEMLPHCQGAGAGADALPQPRVALAFRLPDRSGSMCWINFWWWRCRRNSSTAATCRRGSPTPGARAKAGSSAPPSGRRFPADAGALCRGPPRRIPFLAARRFLPLDPLRAGCGPAPDRSSPGMDPGARHLDIWC